MLKGLAAIENKINNLRKFQENAPSLSIDALMESKHIVLDMNFSDQLDTEGVNSRNVPIMDYKPYSPATIWYKKGKRQPTDRVTLNEHGDFHSGGDRERVDMLTAEIISTDSKSEALQDKYGKEILGLKPDNMNEVREYYVKPYLINELARV